MNWESYAKASSRAINSPNSSALRELIHSELSDTKISPTTAVTISRSPKWYEIIDPTKKITTEHKSPLEEIESATPGMLEHLQDRLNLPNLSSTAYSHAAMRALLLLTPANFTWPRRWTNQSMSESALKSFHKSLWLVPAQDGPFFYTRSHLSALQNCAVLFSTNFQIIFLLEKKHNTI